MKITRIKNVIVIAIVIEVISLFLMYNSFSNKRISETTEKVKINRKQFAMYVQNAQNEYEEVTNTDTFPTDKELNLTNSYCVDASGVRVNNAISLVNDKPTVTSNRKLFCYLYFDNKATSIVINTSNIQTVSGYNKSITCTTAGTPYYSALWNGIVFNDVTSTSEKCQLTYSADVEAHTNDLLSSIVQNNATDETSIVGSDFSNASTLSQSDYNMTDPFYISNQAWSQYNVNYTPNTNNAVTEASALSYDSTNNYWVASPTVNSKNYYYLMKVNTSGYYRLCFNYVGETTTSRTIRFFKNTSEYTYIQGVASASDCYDLDYVDSNDTIRIFYATRTATSATFSFYLQQGTPKTYDLGYRYEGSDPNNYIWFNNEMWRIIGLIPTITSLGENNEPTIEYLVKIIRNDSIGSLVYHHASGTYSWGSNSLYSLLNTYYRNSQISPTGAQYGCLSYSNRQTKCNYTLIGLSNNTYYGSMVKPGVYWYTGAGSIVSLPISFYASEMSSVIQGDVGLIGASDYGFAAINHNSIFNSNAGTLYQNWLYKYGYEWFINGLHMSGNAITVSSVISGNYVRPVVYLSNDVYKVSGTGTEDNPYLIAKRQNQS